jgi:hypothetical protein
MPLTHSDRSDDASALMVLTPIKPGHEQALSDELHRAPGSPSPLADLPRTHFGRWVILENFVTDPAQGKDEELGCQYLIFTSNFDGELESYLDELSARPWAGQIWSHCIGCPAPAAGLRDYLVRNQIHTGFFYASYGTASAPQVKAALATRREMIAFATEAQELDPPTLQARFVKRFGR